MARQGVRLNGKTKVYVLMERQNCTSKLQLYIQMERQKSTIKWQDKCLPLNCKTKVYRSNGKEK